MAIYFAATECLGRVEVDGFPTRDQRNIWVRSHSFPRGCRGLSRAITRAEAEQLLGGPAESFRDDHVANPEPDRIYFTPMQVTHWADFQR